MKALLATSGFDIMQWASSVPDVIAHFLSTEGHELWQLANKADPQRPILGLTRHCSQDTLGYKLRPVSTNGEISISNINHILANKYDPLGYIIPFATRAKLIVQKLWKRVQDWDEPVPADLISE